MDVRPLRPCRRLIHHERGDRPRTYRHARKRTAGTDRKSAIAVHSGADQRAGSHPRARRRRTAGMAEHAGRAPDAEKDGPQWATMNDNRVTKWGKIMRATRIDELPQLWNVIRGEMSFVGPRPEREFFIQQLEQEMPYYNLRHTVKPGLTGWAQVMYPYGASVEDAYNKLQYDLYYIKHNNTIFDIMVILKTINIVVFGKGR